MKERSAIYGLYDPLKPERIKYVGCSRFIPDRFATHASGGDDATGAWVKSIRAKGGSIRMIILEVAKASIAPRREAWWISSLMPELNTKSATPVIAPALLGVWEPCYYWAEGNMYFSSMRKIAQEFDLAYWPTRKAIMRHLPLLLPDGRKIMITTKAHQRELTR